MAEPFLVDSSSKFAVQADGDFVWEALKKPELTDKEKKKAEAEEKAAKEKAKKERAAEKKRNKKNKKGGDAEGVLPTTAPAAGKDEKKEEEAEPFGLKGLAFNIPKGDFVTVVGPVGSGKSSVLQVRHSHQGCRKVC